jgi:hypothetical protein
MCNNLLKDSRTFSFLLQIDRDTETRVSQAACGFCGDRLHRADFLRKPRAPGIDLAEDFCRRPSFCCRRDGCRRRQTPALLRFLGRRVYVSIVVVLITAMTQGASAKRLCDLQAQLGVPPQTVRRWQHYWRAIFSNQSGWQYLRGNLLPRIADEDLPRSLLDRLSTNMNDELGALICLLRLANSCSKSP